MGIWDGKVSDIKPSLTDWLTQRGGTTSDLPLSLINRAIQRLWAYRPWDFLTKTYTLTAGTQNGTVGVNAGFTHTESSLTVTITDTSKGALLWDYDWGDSSTHATTASPSHTYAEAGTYSVVQSINNGVETETHSVTVTAPVADFSFTDGSATWPSDVVFFDNIQMTDLSTGATTWLYELYQKSGGVYVLLASYTTQNPLIDYGEQYVDSKIKLTINGGSIKESDVFQWHFPP